MEQTTTIASTVSQHNGGATQTVEQSSGEGRQALEGEHDFAKVFSGVSVLLRVRFGTRQEVNRK